MMEQAPLFSHDASAASRWWAWSQAPEPHEANDNPLSVRVEPDRGDSKETETEATGTWLARAVLVLHLLLWIASIALVASLYGLHTPLPQPTYALAPLLDASASGDVVPLLALRARGLFADVSVAVACLVAQTAVYALVVPERRFAGFIVVATAILVLFMQEKWYLSFGGLLWSELVLAFTFFAVGTRARGAAGRARCRRSTSPTSTRCRWRSPW